MSSPPASLTLDLLKSSSPNIFLWDFAGVDGLQAAIALFSPGVSRLAPFQSLTAKFEQQSCSVLRLCENNFRVALPEHLTFNTAIAALGLDVWVQPFPAATLVIPVNAGLERLRVIGTTKPIYTLNPFPCDRAVPARLSNIAILIWHHYWQGELQLAIQTARKNLDAVQQMLVYQSVTDRS